MTSAPPVAERTSSQPEHPVRLPRRIYLMIILGALGALAPLSIDMYLPALPALSRSFGTNASQIQLTLSAFVLGIALGQIIAGPLSDAVGRRRPLLIGLGAYALASLLCAGAPSAGILIGLRFVQGVAGAAGIVLASAIVRDLYTGVAAARFFSLLMLVSGLAPILAPIFGAQMLRFTSWHGVFIVLAGLGMLLLLASATSLGETLPAARRQSGGMRAMLLTFGKLLTDRFFLGYALSSGLCFAAMFTYISGSPFVLQGIYRVTPQQFSLMFGLNATGLIIASQINARIVGRIAPGRLLVGGLIASAAGGIALLGAIVAGLGLPGILPALFVVVSSLGFVRPNATALALAGHPDSAGSAAALIGVLQFAIGSIVAPLAGIGGGVSAVPMATVIAVCGASGLAALVALART